MDSSAGACRDAHPCCTGWRYRALWCAGDRGGGQHNLGGECASGVVLDRLTSDSQPAGQMTLLGGINMVDYDPWSGNYTGTVVQNNIIYGGFASDPAVAGDTKGDNDEDAIIK